MPHDLLVWVSGLVLGTALTDIYYRHKLAKFNKDLEASLMEAAKVTQNHLDSLKKDYLKHTKNALVAQQKLDKVTTLIKEQAHLSDSLDAPSKGAAHSKHKNEIVRKIKAMETEKYQLLQEVLDSGLNPTISVIIGGEQLNMKLSEFIARHNSDTPPEPPTTDPNKPRNKPILRRVK